MARAIEFPTKTGGTIFVYAISFLLVLVAGVVASFGNLIVVVVLAGAGAGLVLLTKPVLMFWLLFIITYVAHGSVQFFLGFSQLQWISSLLGVSLIAVWMLSGLRVNETDKSSFGSPVMISALIFFLVMGFSSVVNANDFLQVLVAVRIYLPFWGVYFLISRGPVNPEHLQRAFFAFFAVGAIQWPVELYQKIFVVSARSAARYFGSAFDSVVGTFGGSMFGGGESGSLAVFLVIVLVLIAALRQHNQISRSLAWFFFFSAVVAIGLSETKAVFVLIPIGFAWLYRSYMVRRPVAFIFGSLGALVLLTAILFAYYKLHWESQGQRADPVALIQQKFLYSFDPEFMPAPDWPGRLTGLVIWMRHHGTDDPLRLLFGHGAASSISKSSLIGQGDASRQYGQGLDVTGATKLLWETGLLGFAAFLGIIATAFMQANKLARRPELPLWHSALMRGIETSMPLIALAIFYEATAVSSPPMQLTFCLLLGYVDFWRRKVASIARATR